MRNSLRALNYSWRLLKWRLICHLSPRSTCVKLALFLDSKKSPNLVRRVAAQLEGIGWEKSAAVATRFATVLDMVVATEKEWQAVPGVGKTLAARAVQQLTQGRE